MMPERARARKVKAEAYHSTDALETRERRFQRRPMFVQLLRTGPFQPVNPHNPDIPHPKVVFCKRVAFVQIVILILAIRAPTPTFKISVRAEGKPNYWRQEGNNHKASHHCAYFLPMLHCCLAGEFNCPQPADETVRDGWYHFEKDWHLFVKRAMAALIL